MLLTAFGKKLRSTSLNEWPEMYLDGYSEEQQHRHDVKLRTTGYAQANGRNAIGWDESLPWTWIM